jgi:hypothetical protein
MGELFTRCGDDLTILFPSNTHFVAFSRLTIVSHRVIVLCDCNREVSYTTGIHLFRQLLDYNADTTRP